jgi:large subunit ribosomal protein L6
MKKEIFNKIKIPEGINFEIDGNLIRIKKDNFVNEKKFNIGNIKLEKKNNEIIIGSETASKKEKRMINTITSHIKNMIKGLEKPYEYKLKVCFNHFPITVEQKGDEVLIKNFLGERYPRKVKVDTKNVQIKIEKEIITITSHNKEIAGQTAANLEMITRIPNRDRRIFQDGIFIINKNGKHI